jgi:hypothetical protein
MNGTLKRWLAGVTATLVVAFVIALSSFMYKVSIFMNAGQRFTPKDATVLQSELDEKFVSKEMLEIKMEILVTKIDAIQRDVDKIYARVHEEGE